MKNFEYFEKEIKEVVMNNKPLAVVDGKPCCCHDVPCFKCAFDHNRDDALITCEAKTFEWLYEEHVEQPKISARTKKFFEAIETGWVARDLGSKVVCLFTNKPQRMDDIWYIDLGTILEANNKIFNFLTLDFIKWEDEEPWSVEDILKLEVER